jgi:ParB/Sulfiredoxin domain
MLPAQKPVFPEENGQFGPAEIAKLWPADQVERRPIGELMPSARNARQHSDAQIGQLMASIREWGWTMPILIDETGSIIAGHGRVRAAELLGIDQVPVMVARGWTEAQKRAYLIADNKLTENGSWDEALLRIELGDLAETGFATLTGFNEVELREMGVGVDGLDGMPRLADGGKSPFQQMTFILLTAQAEIVNAAIERASERLGPPTDADQNKNLNGNALAEICRAYLGANVTS